MDGKSIVSELFSDTLDIYKEIIYDPQGRPYPRRMIFKHIVDLVDKGTPLILLYGLRGTGKTFLLLQLLDHYLRSGVDVLYVPMDRLYRRVGDPSQTFQAVFDYLGYRPHELRRRTILLLDEVHSVRGWDGWLKDIYDASYFNKKLSVVATGSSSISLMAGSELRRRALIRELTPLQFSEYLMLKYEGWKPPRGSRRALNNSFFGGRNLRKVYELLRTSLLKLGSPVSLFEGYLATGGFPLFKRYGEGTLYFEMLEGIIQKIVADDLPRSGEFESSTLSAVPDILTFLAEAVGSPVSLDRLSRRTGLTRGTVWKLLRVLVDSSLLIEVKHCGASSALREPRKYYFNHPNLIPVLLGYRSQRHLRSLLPQLLENAIASFLSWNSRVNKLCYPSPVDFYVETRQGPVLIEVGVKKERESQFGRSGINARRVIVNLEDVLQEGEVIRVPAYLLGFL
ncbi:MAG: ATP-binding protein [Candidatus Diapherotrites archaeon]|nr:ATP-binding protein [Candidatus Diapherotrites archaeon]